MTERRMERLRPDQFRRLRQEMPLAYLPLGILEWHGPQNPMGLDGVKAHAVCRRVAEQVGGIVFPTMYYGPPPASNYVEVDGFRPEFTAAYGLPDDHFATNRFRFGDRVDQWHLFGRVLDQALRQIARYGFEAILVLSGHYPLRMQQYVTIGIQRDFGIPVWFGHEGESCDPPEGDHAGWWETSVTMALEPDTVDPGAFPSAGEPNPPGVGGKPVSEVTPEVARHNLERAVVGLVSQARTLLEQRAHLQQRKENR